MRLHIPKTLPIGMIISLMVFLIIVGFLLKSSESKIAQEAVGEAKATPTLVAFAETDTDFSLRVVNNSSKEGRKSSHAENIHQLNRKIPWDASGAGFEAEALSLLIAWAKQEPEAALAFALGNLEDNNIHPSFLGLVEPVLAIWVDEDPEAARRFVHDYGLSLRAAELLAPPMMQKYGTEFPEKAIEWVTLEFDTDSGDLRPVLAEALITVLIQNKQDELAQQWLTDPRVMGYAYSLEATRIYAGHLASRSPLEAFQFAQNLRLGSTARGYAFQETFRSWAEQEPNEVVDWINYTLQNNMFNTIESPINGEINREIPKGKVTSGDMDSIIGGYVLGVADDARAESLIGLQSINSRSIREHIKEQL